MELIDDPTVNVNFAPSDEYGRTPLWWSACNGHFNIARALLSHPDIKVNEADINRWTPLLIAADCGHDKVVAFLLNHPKIEVNLTNREEIFFDAALKIKKALLYEFLVNAHYDAGQLVYTYVRNVGEDWPNLHQCEPNSPSPESLFHREAIQI